MENDEEAINRDLAFYVDHVECGRRVKKSEGIKEKGFRLYVKRKAIEYKLSREKMFKVDEVLDGENTRSTLL